MNSKILYEADGLRTFAVVMDSGDEVMSSLHAISRERKITAAQITGIGAFRECTLAYFDWDLKEYRHIPVREQVEVASLVGDAGEAPGGKPAVHIHLVLGRRNGDAMAGHLIEAHVRPTLELIITELPSHLRRRRDAATGLNLLRL